VQIVAMIAYVHRLVRYVPVAARDEDLPPALVILSLRGGDDALLECLDRLANQNYPAYQLRIVIDHPTDPAHKIVNRWLEKRPSVAVAVEFLRNPSPNSTLKCSAIRQVLHNLDFTIQAVVLVDADANTYPGWLRDMVSPLRLPSVGAVTGNRWYYPAQGSWGAWCRFIYNALTLPPMDWFRLPWAGSLAIRREVAVHRMFLNTLERASSDESAVCKALKEMRLQLHFNSRVILWNSSSENVAGCSQFIFRQLLWTRLYHPSWIPILAHAVGSYLLLALAFLCGVSNLWIGTLSTPAAALLGAIGIYLAAVLFSLGYLHRAIRIHILPHQGDSSMRGLRLRDWCQMVGAAPMTLVVYTLAILRARFARRVVWRGIEYHVQSHGAVRVSEYRPIFGQPAPTS